MSWIHVIECDVCIPPSSRTMTYEGYDYETKGVVWVRAYHNGWRRRMGLGVMMHVCPSCIEGAEGDKK